MHHRRFSLEAEVRLPQPPPPTVSPNGFLLCPTFWGQGMTPEQLLWQQWVYQVAFAQAQAVVRPSLPERDLLAVWN
jgi:hypothetical protein